MDKASRYEAMILEIITRIVGVKYSNEPELRNELIADTKNHRYQVNMMGWDKEGNRVHRCLIHIDIIDGKIWVQENWTEIDPGRELVYKGVPPSDIVVGFLTPKMRELSDYAIA